MEQIKITSGSTVVLASGTVTAFKNNPIELKIGPDDDYMRMIFFFEKTDEKSQGIKGEPLDKKTLKITIKHVPNSLGSWNTEPLSVGTYEHKPLYLNVRYYTQDMNNIMLHYTFYLEDISNDPQTVGAYLTQPKSEAKLS